ncbi:DNA-binding NtrC family response regulator [Albidovulum inexpectatum]|uniref:DNA-binding NtrC family response regulator n=1 Tax=Albidovulum inexpectatum TaxID=196587 RepID=A0A2S5JLP5_9RHOB|nr:response regulator [Albidovulum inexpectatum]PPB82352.1 DNA-binding NtrC family response regulator [Albidovulum inexpectatum]
MLHERRIVLVEDDEIMGASLAQRLTLEGAEVQWHRRIARALPAIRTPRRPIDAVVCDIRLPDGTGEQLYTRLIGTSAPPPFLFITGQGDVAQAVRLIRSGAADYITKPFEMRRFLEKLARVMQPRDHGAAFEQTGISAMARAVDRQAAELARTDQPLMIRGLSGLGKVRLARQIHQSSDRRAAPLIVLDALREEISPAAMDDASRRAGEGTLLIVGIGRLSLSTQDRLAELLRGAAFRLVATAGMGLEARVADGGFRADLFDLLCAHAIVIPPLSERPEDAVWLAVRLFAALNDGRRAGLADPTIEAIRTHDWPGNGRELRARLTRAIESSRESLILPVDLFPERLAADDVKPLSEVREAAERAHIAAVLARTGGQVGEAARLLRISRTTLWEKMQKFGL